MDILPLTPSIVCTSCLPNHVVTDAIDTCMYKCEACRNAYMYISESKASMQQCLFVGVMK